MKNLFYFLDTFNLPVSIPIEYFGIERIILLVNNKYYKRYEINIFKDFILDEFSEISIEVESFNEHSEINTIIKKHSGKNYGYFDGEINVNEMVLFSAVDFFESRIVLSENNTILYEFKKEEEIIEHDIGTYEYAIEDLVDSFGGSIYSDDSNTFSTEGVTDYIRWITSNYDYFEKLNQNVFKRVKIFVNDKKHLSSSMILLWKLDDYTQYLLMNLLDFLKEKNYLNYNINESKKILYINYHDHGLKKVMKKPGIWLEAKVYNLLSNMGFFDEVKAGVEFIWTKDSDKIKNEIDIVAIKDQKVLCISCKDTKRHNKESYNELILYTEKLAGAQGKSLLVATEDPVYVHDLKRIDQMDLEYLLFQGDDKQFKCLIERII